jgi:predicted deacetylase
VDFDDFCDVTLPELDMIAQIKDALPQFCCTLFTIPMRTSVKTLEAAQRLGDWVRLAPHGWRHTKGECFAWSDEEAELKIRAAADMGINEPIFRAPGWLLDGDVYAACERLNYAVAAHKIFRVPNTNVAEYVYNMARSGDTSFRAFHGHMTNCGFNYIKDMHEEGRLHFHPSAEFVQPAEVAYVHAGEAVCAP